MKNPAFPFRSFPWLILGLIASVLAIVGLIFNGSTIFLRAYLFSYLFWLGITLGCLSIAMVAYLTNARWGQISRWIVQAGAKTIWLMLILFIPIAAGLANLYVWAVPANVSASSLLAHKSSYLNAPFFLLRAVFYFVVWIVFAQVLDRMAGRHETYSNPNRQRLFRGLSAVGIIVYFLTMSFASVDWVMSLSPDWYSTIFGMLVILGQALSAFAFILLILPRLAQYEPIKSAITIRDYQDVAGLLLTCVMTWAYLAFSQLLIIWSGNLPEEVSWYFDRTGSWLWVGTLVAALQFGLPFLFLLSMSVRQNSSILAGLGLLILAMRLLDNFWMVMPAFSPQQFSLHWLDFVLPAAMGGLWMATFTWFMDHTTFFLPEKSEVPEKPEVGAPSIS